MDNLASFFRTNPTSTTPI